MRDLAKSRAPVFIYLIFISLVMVRVMIKARVRVLGPHVAQISYCELFGNASYLA